MSNSNKFTAELKNLMPGFNVKFKDESTFMRVLGTILFFKKRFMTGFVTTIGKTVYFPSKANFLERGDRAMITLAHEYVHARDANKRTMILFSFLYLFPQFLALPGLLLALTSPIWIVLMLLGILSWTWWLLLFLGTLLFLAPIPAPWRKHYEIKGYTMSLFMFDQFKKRQGADIEKRRHYLYEYAKNMNDNFTGGNYYFMWPFGVTKKLRQNADKIVSGRIMMEDEVYSEVLHAAKQSGLL